MTIEGVLLDVDGTLILSNDAHAQAWVDAFATGGYDMVTFEQVRPLIGMGGDRLMSIVVPGLSDEEGRGKTISQYRSKLFLSEFVDQVQPAQGARDLVLKLQSCGLKVIVASSAKPEELGSLLKAAQVDDLLPEATTSGDVENSKPSPDIVEAALNKIGLSADRVVMIGDTPYDVEAAGRAGVNVIAVRCGGFSDQELTGAIAIYDDPSDLLQQFDRSPFGQVTGMK